MNNVQYVVLTIITALIVIFLSTCGSNADKVSLFAENDIVASTDKDYTHGTAFKYQYAYTNDVPLLFGEVESLEWSLTQLIYTPYPKTVVELQPDERPYAGFLGVGLNAKSFLNERTQLEEGLVIGVVGPLSFSEQTQKTIHKWVDSAEPLGWDNQLHNEPILNYHYTANYKLVYGNYFDIISRSEAALGNMFTYVDSGLMARLGYNLKNNFGFSRIEPTVKAFKKSDIYFYVFAYPDGRWMIHNIFLDGNTFEDSHSIDKEPFVGDFSYGAAIGIGRLEAAYSYVFRSREFKLQEDYDRFGAVTISWSF